MNKFKILFFLLFLLAASASVKVHAQPENQYASSVGTKGIYIAQYSQPSPAVITPQSQTMQVTSPPQPPVRYPDHQRTTPNSSVPSPQPANDVQRDPNSITTKTSPVKIDETVANALRSGRISLNFDNLDIRAVSKIMAQLTKRTIILDKAVSGTITIISSRKVSINEAWDLYLSALEASGFGMVRSGGAFKVVPIAVAQKENTRYVGTKPVSSSGKTVVALVLLNNADSEIMMNTLKPLVIPPAVISSYQPSNAIILTDISQNVSRLTQIIRQLDNNYKGSTMRIFQPKHIRVKELAVALQNVFQGSTPAGVPGAGGSLQIRFSAYEPTNTLLVMAPYKDFMQIERAIAEIDNESRIIKTEERAFRVYYLKNANAVEVAKSIASIMEERKRIVEAIKTEQQGTEAAKSNENLVSTKVGADAATNSLIFYATDKEYDELVGMIEKLDAPQKQVLITAIIAETQADNSLEAGIAWQALANPGVLAAFQAGVDQGGLLQLIQNGGFALGAIGSETTNINVNGSEMAVPKLFGIIKAMETKTNFNLLSAPKVVTHDHKPALLLAAQQLPFAKGVSYNTNGYPVISYDYQKVGLNLDVTPHVGQNDQVRLEIDLKIDDLISYLTQGTGAGAVQTPITSTREVKNNITLKDGDTIVIGGLIVQKTTEVIKQVPILSKIPLIGGLFKNKRTDKTLRTLFVFITPHIINTPEDLKDVTDKYGRIVFREKPVNENAPFTVEKKGERVTNDNTRTY